VIRGDRPYDHPSDRPGDRVGELAIEVAVLRERISDKDAVIADLRHRLKLADRRLDDAAEERRLVNRLREALADTVAAERIAAGEAAGLRAELETRREWRFFRRLVWALRRR
jgi:hypothetical protein